MRRDAEPGGDFVCAKAAFFRELLERLELIAGMHVLARDIFIEADFAWIVRGVDDAADRLSLFDLLALDAEKLRQPATFADGDQIEPCGRAIRIQFWFDNKVLQDAFRGNAGGICFNRRHAVRCLAGVVRGFLEFVEWNETLSATLCDGRSFLGRHDRSPFRVGGASAPLRCSPARRRDRGSKGKGGRGGGGSPGLHKRVSVVSFPVLSSARKVGETAPAGPGFAGTSPLPARGRSP